MKKALMFVPSDYMEVAPEKYISFNIRNALKEEYEIEFIEISVSAKEKNKKAYKKYIKEKVHEKMQDDIVEVFALTTGVGSFISDYLPKNMRKICYVGDCNVKMNRVNFSIQNLINGSYFGKNIRRFLYGYREKKVLENYDCCLYITRIDMEYSKKKFGPYGEKRGLIRYGIEIPNETSKPRGKMRENIIIGFIGTFTEYTIDMYFKEFFRQYRDLLSEKYPMVKFVIAGRNISEWQKKYLENYSFVQVIGEVKSLEEFYDSVDIMISTCCEQTGILTKILEAFSYGKCVAGYNLDFEAIEQTKNNMHYLGFDSMQEFEAILEKIIANEIDIDEIGRNARKIIEENYLIKDMHKDIVKSVCNRKM